MIQSRCLRLLLLCVLACLPACNGIRTVLIPPGTPVMLAETVEGVDVWVFDGDGELVRSRTDLPEGWWCIQDTGRK